MINSPFIYGSTVSGNSFTDRENEIRKLTGNLLGGINTMIISPRRWGKSSLVEKVTDSIKAGYPKVKIALIDLFTVSSEEQFLEKYAGEILKASTMKWEERVRDAKKFFKNIIPRIQISADPATSFSVSFDWKEIKQQSDEILNLPETISRQKKIRIIVCLDEFQSIAGFPGYENFEKKLRSVWQRHKRVTYCIYGSKRHMMTDIFNNPSKPFYRFGDIMMLGKISREVWISHIRERFSATGKVISTGEAGIIADLMKCHSWYVQQLSHYTWNLPGKKVSAKDIYNALNELINANMPLYQRDMEDLSTSQLNLLIAVAKGERQLTSARVMNEYRLGTPNNVTKNKTVLISNDVIGEEGGGYSFLDPAFELWFGKVYLDRSIWLY
jgi:AAA+ ATPase superfamily predicted ATPase